MLTILLWLWVVVLLVAFARTLWRRPTLDGWRSTHAPTNEERYLDWVDRYADYEAAQRKRRVRHALARARAQYSDYTATSVVHVPAPRSAV